ncbi:MAG: hypothetical protein ACTTKH_04390 [Treponema sp.]
MKKTMLWCLALVAFLFAFSCNQGANVQAQKPNEANKITITVKGDAGIKVAMPDSFTVDKGAKWENIKAQAIAKVMAKEGFSIKDWHLNDANGALLTDETKFEENTIIFVVAKKIEKPVEQVILTIEADAGYTFKDSKKPCTIEIQKGAKWASVKEKAEEKITLANEYEAVGWKLGSKDGAFLDDQSSFNEDSVVYASSKAKGSPEVEKIQIEVKGDEHIEVASANSFTVVKGSKWKDIKLTAMTKAMAKEGFSIKDWHLNDANGNKLEEDYEFNKNEIVFALSKKQNRQVKYKVEHWHENIENDNFTKIDTEEKSGEAGKTTDAKPKRYEGFNAQSFEQNIIQADGSTTIKIQYKRAIFSIVLDLDGGETTTKLEDGMDGKKLLKGKFGAEVKVEEPSKEGCAFRKWKPELPNVFSKVEAQKVYVAKWNVNFNVSVSNIRPIAASFSIEPSNGTVTYAFGIMTKAKYDDAIASAKKDGKDPKLATFYHDLSWNKHLQSVLHYSTWQEAAKREGYYKKGAQEVENVVSQGYIKKDDIAPETECIAYWYLIKETDEMPDSEIFIRQFKTAEIQPSTNKLTLTVTKAYKNAVDFKVTATNDDSYTIVIGSKKNLDWYLNSSKYTLTDWAKKIIVEREAVGYNVELFNGDKDFYGFKSFNYGNMGSEFAILYFVYDHDNGIRSKVNYVIFETTSEEAP